MMGAPIPPAPGACPWLLLQRRRRHPRHRRTVSAPAGCVDHRPTLDDWVGDAAAATVAAASTATATPPTSRRDVAGTSRGSRGCGGGVGARGHPTRAHPPLPAAAAARVARDVAQLRGEAPPFVEVSWDEPAAASRVWALVVGALGTPYALRSWVSSSGGGGGRERTEGEKQRRAKEQQERGAGGGWRTRGGRGVRHRRLALLTEKPDMPEPLTMPVRALGGLRHARLPPPPALATPS